MTANRMRNTSAIPTPNISTLRRSRAGSPEASEPMITTLSPAIVRSPMMICPSLASPPAVKIAPKSRLSSTGGFLLVHAREEVLIRLGVLHLVEKELHRVDGAHLHQDAAQHPHLGERALIDE